MDFDQDTIIFLLVSMINVPTDRLLRYGFPRSIFPLETRFQQSIDCIKSIKDKMQGQNYRIIFLDSSDLPQQYVDMLSREVDLLKLYYTDPEVHECSHSDCKSRGESCLLNTFLKSFSEEYKDKKFRTLIKFTGRYTLNEHFDLNRFISDKMVFRKHQMLPDYNYKSQINLTTSLYSVPYHFFPDYCQQIEKCHEFLKSCEFYDFENCIGYGIEDKIEICDTLGLTYRCTYEDVFSTQ